MQEECRERGDIIISDKGICVVVDDAGHVADGSGVLGACEDKHARVVGNIFRNPQLLFGYAYSTFHGELCDCGLMPILQELLAEGEKEVKWPS